MLTFDQNDVHFGVRTPSSDKIFAVISGSMPAVRARVLRKHADIDIFVLWPSDRKVHFNRYFHPHFQNIVVGNGKAARRTYPSSDWIVYTSRGVQFIVAFMSSTCVCHKHLSALFFERFHHCTRFRLVVANCPTRRSKKSQLAFPLYIPYSPDHSTHVITQTTRLPFHADCCKEADRGYPGKHRTNRLPAAHVPPSLAQQCMLTLLRTDRTDTKFWTREPHGGRLRSRNLNGILYPNASHSLLRRTAPTSAF